MMATMTTTREATIARLRERISEAERELNRTPQFKRGTVWHVDRINELNSLRGSLARMTILGE